MSVSQVFFVNAVPVQTNIGWRGDAQFSTDGSYNVQLVGSTFDFVDDGTSTSKFKVTDGTRGGQTEHAGVKLNSTANPQSGALFIEDWGSVISGPPNTNARLVRNGGIPQLLHNLDYTGTPIKWRISEQVGGAWSGALYEVGNEGHAWFVANGQGGVGTPLKEVARFRCPLDGEFCIYTGTSFFIGNNRNGQRELPATAVLQVTNGIEDDGTITDVSSFRSIAHFERISSHGQAVPNPGPVSGTAQSGGASSIELDATHQQENDYYNGYTIAITSGTGSGQSRTVADYTYLSNTASVTVAWGTEPDETSEYTLTPVSAVYGDLTATVTIPLRINNKSTGTPVENFGCGMQYAIQGSGIAERVVVQTDGYLTDDTRNNGAFRIKIQESGTLTEKATFQNDGLHVDDGLGVWFKDPPTSQAVKINDPTDLGSAITAINALIDIIESYGFAKEDNYASLVGKALAYWPLQDTSGTTITDSLGSSDGTLTVDASTLTVMDGPATMSGNLPVSLAFSGSEWIHSAGDTDQFRDIHETNIWSICFWIKIPTLSGRYSLLGSTALTTEKGFYVEYSNGVGFGTQAIRVQVNKGASPPVVHVYSVNNIINDNDWHHIAVTSGSGTANKVKMYVDGALRFPTNYSTSVSSVGSGSATRTLKLADSNYTSEPFIPFVGQLCGVGIWGFELTPTKIDLLVNEP